jgi:hypothetical protein
MLFDSLKSGKLTLSQNNDPKIEVNVRNKNIDVNAIDKKFIKEIISSATKGTTKKGVGQTIRRSIKAVQETRKMQPFIKEMAEDLCREGITITLHYKGDRVATVGAEANSKFTRLITKTRGIEINSPIKLAELGI